MTSYTKGKIITPPSSPQQQHQQQQRQHITTKKKKSIRWAETTWSHKNNSTERENNNDKNIIILSEKELRKLWYNDKDYKKFKVDCKDTIRLLKDVKYNHEKCKSKHRNTDIIMKNVCERGLENRINKKNGQRQSKISQDSINVVLEEQSDQWYYGTYSPDFLAELYQDVSGLCQHDAYLKGLQDEKEARAVCFEEECLNNKKQNKKTLGKKTHKSNSFVDYSSSKKRSSTSYSSSSSIKSRTSSSSSSSLPRRRSHNHSRTTRRC